MCTVVQSARTSARVQLQFVKCYTLTESAHDLSHFAVLCVLFFVCFLCIRVVLVFSW